MSDDTLASDPLTLKVARLRPDARLPTKAHADDAAFDLYAVEPCTPRYGMVNAVPTGIAVEIPVGWFAQILGRSSIAVKGVTPLGGCIDSGYRGEWIVNLFVPYHPFSIQPGDRIAQFVLVRVPPAVVVEVGADEMSASERGSKGFGSSGR